LISPANINQKRIRLLQAGTETEGPVIYWMSRDQRVHDNWALLFAQRLALEKKFPLAVVFNIVPDFLEATIRQYGFMLKGLKELEEELKHYNLPFFLLYGRPEEEILKFIKTNNASVFVSDFDPLRIKRIWKKKLPRKFEYLFMRLTLTTLFLVYTFRINWSLLLIQFVRRSTKH